MESAAPHTIGSVLLTRERRFPDHVPDHMMGYTDPPLGFNSVKYRHEGGFYGGGNWQDYEDIPRYVTLRDHVIGTRDHVIGTQDHVIGTQDHVIAARNQNLTSSLRSRQDAFRKPKPLDYDLVLAARKAAAKDTVNNENYCEIGDQAGAPVTEKTKEKPLPYSVESVSEFMQSITASFIRFIFEEGSPLCRRALWFLFWVTCCGYALSNIHAAFAQYFAFETASQLSYTEAIGKGLTMPAVTICNMNKYRRSWLNLPKNSVVKKYEEKRVWGNDNLTDVDLDNAKNMSVDDLEKEGKHSMRMFQSLKFDEEDIDPNDEHLKEINTELGVCYTFNENGTKKVRRTGTEFGATFLIDINQNDYPETQESAGIKVMLHHYKEPPLIKEYGLAIPPGSEAYISTRTLRLRNLGAPYFNCTSRALRSTGYYSVVGCTLECHAQILEEECQCKQSHMPLDNIPVCSLFQEQNCVAAAIKKIHNGSFTDRIEECWCIDACDDTTYEYKLSRAQFPGQMAGENMVESFQDLKYKTVSSLRENFIRLHVYFKSLAIEHVEKVAAYTTMNLLGDVGGNLGLFIGANVATLGELIDYAARRIRGAVHRK